jgi:hypothetical protein
LPTLLSIPPACGEAPSHGKTAGRRRRRASACPCPRCNPAADSPGASAPRTGEGRSK